MMNKVICYRHCSKSRGSAFIFASRQFETAFLCLDLGLEVILLGVTARLHSLEYWQCQPLTLFETFAEWQTMPVLLCPRPGSIKRWCCLTSDVCLSGVCLAQGCRCVLSLQAWAAAYRGGRPPTTCLLIISCFWVPWTYGYFLACILLPCRIRYASFLETFWSGSLLSWSCCRS